MLVLETELGVRTKKRASRGFTIPEILIAIAVITIAMLGTIAAIAFGLRAARVGGDDSVALSVNRKIVELILQNQYSPGLSVFNHGPADPTAARGTSPWRPLYDSSGGSQWFSLNDYGYNNNSEDQQNFVSNSEKYELDVSCVKQSPANSLSVDKAFYLITVQTRWQDKGRWRSLKTEAYSVSAGYN